MSNKIKIIPTLTGKDAERFIKKAEEANKNRRHTIDFSEKIASMRRILNKSEIPS